MKINRSAPIISIPGLDNFVSYADEVQWTVGPHAITNRLTYTVPAGKVFVISGMHAQILRKTVPSVIGTAEIYFTLSTSIASSDIVARLSHSNNSTVETAEKTAFINQMVEAGETIGMDTFDASTGGLMLYNMGFSGTLYTL